LALSSLYFYLHALFCHSHFLVVVVMAFLSWSLPGKGREGKDSYWYIQVLNKGKDKFEKGLQNKTTQSQSFVPSFEITFMKKMFTCHYEVKPPVFGMRTSHFPVGIIRIPRPYAMQQRRPRCILFYTGVVGVKDNLFTAFVVVWCLFRTFSKTHLHTFLTWGIVGVEVNLHAAFVVVLWCFLELFLKPICILFWRGG